jgi:xylulokinase
MSKFLGIDVGTSSVKAVLLDERQFIVAEASVALTVARPHPLWSEQNPEDWWQATLGAVDRIREKAPRDWLGLAGIGLSGQMHGATLLDRGGRVLRPAILWNDGRSSAECAELQRRIPDFLAHAANIAMPGFTAPKVMWVANHEPDVFAATAKVLLPKDYVRYRLSGAYVCDLSDASGTLWLNIAGRRWDEVLLEGSGLSRAYMPDLVEGSEPSANLSTDLLASWGLAGRRIPIAGGAGDNAASAVGIGAVSAGRGFLSLGTSGVLFAVTDRFVARPERTMHAMCHALPGRWHGMSVILSAASALDWVARLTGHAADIGGLLTKAEAFAADSTRVRRAPIFLPYLTGERTPHNDPSATGLFAGLTAEHDAAALAYSVLEGVAFAFADGLDVLDAAGARPTNTMLVGGGARSAYWAQLIADATGLTLDVPESAEVGAAFGAARLGMLAVEAGTEAELLAAMPIRASFSANKDLAWLKLRLERYRALYTAELTAR